MQSAEEKHLELDEEDIFDSGEERYSPEIPIDFNDRDEREYEEDIWNQINEDEDPWSDEPLPDYEEPFIEYDEYE